MKEIMPGDRVLVFDCSLYKNDIDTPLSHTMRPATVVRRYGIRSEYDKSWIYPNLIDVLFDHRPEQISFGHFTVGKVSGMAENCSGKVYE